MAHGEHGPGERRPTSAGRQAEPGGLACSRLKKAGGCGFADKLEFLRVEVCERIEYRLFGPLTLRGVFEIERKQPLESVGCILLVRSGDNIQIRNHLFMQPLDLNDIGSDVPVVQCFRSPSE